MKPMGPVPPGFAAHHDELVIGGRTAEEWAAEAGGTPLFVYSEDRMAAQINDLRAAMPDRLSVHYAVKANPFPGVIAAMSALVDGFDIASGGELQMLIDAGIEPAKVSFAGPGKRDEELHGAIKAGVTLNCESEGEVERALAIGSDLGISPRLAIRVNPDFELKGSGMKMGGGAKPFGVDAKRVPTLAKRIAESQAEWRGLHIYTGSQALNAQSLQETFGNILDLAFQICREAAVELPHLNMGGGFGIPYFNGDEPLDISSIGAFLSDRFAALPKEFAGTEYAIELGRYLVGEAGVYLTRIIERKESHGHTFLITDGGLHHQLAASGNFGTVIRRNYPVAIASRFEAPAAEIASIVGCLCTPLDRLADAVSLPKTEVGDLVAVFCAGAYGATASPAQFLGQGPAFELMAPGSMQTTR